MANLPIIPPNGSATLLRKFLRKFALLIGLFLLFTLPSTAQSFGPISQSPIYADFRNPALPPLFWRNAEFEKWNVLATISPAFNRENRSRPDHYVLAANHHFSMEKRWSWQGKIMLERNAIGAVQHTAAQAGLRLRGRLTDEGAKLEAYLSGGVNFGTRSWWLRDSPNLRPWDFGDPLLAVQRSGRIGGFRNYITLGIAFFGNYEIGSGGTNEDQLEYTLGTSTEIRPASCQSVDCFTFSTPLITTDFSLGLTETPSYGIPQFNADFRFSRRRFEVFSAGYWQYDVRKNSYGINVGGVLKDEESMHDDRRLTFLLGTDYPGPNYRFMAAYSGIILGKNKSSAFRLKLGGEVVIFPGHQFRPPEVLSHFALTPPLK